MRSICSLGLHDQSVSEADVLLNLTLFPPHHEVTLGSVLQLSAVPTGYSVTYGSEQGLPVEPKRGYYFVTQEVDNEVLSKIAGIQVSLSSQIAQAFSLRKGSLVSVADADKSTCGASHVEVAFRDEYLARADMWQLAMTELAGRTIYKNMRIWSMRTIKASVKNVYLNGEKVDSAIFTASTKPIFRSESARYMLLLQMSKEMWGFDAGGSGEIMFSKAINGFLPELFRRWQHINAKHMVTVVLFTRIGYKRTSGINKGEDAEPPRQATHHHKAHSSYKDFYRVVVSDMADGDWAIILGKLKAELKVFLRDVCICRPTPGDHLSLDSGFGAASTSELPEWVIDGHPCSASQGNILEAINLASSQFSTDHLDRDLVRTGVSIAIITPGTGVFEVDYELLLTTTDNLVATGIGIDLICLSRMPLHSVPLFQYRTPTALNTEVMLVPQDQGYKQKLKPVSPRDLGLETSLVAAHTREGIEDEAENLKASSQIEWSYAIPHWIDISFWTSATDEPRLSINGQAKSSNISSSVWQPRKAFRSRVRMYELQMMGIMEDALGEISIPYLPSILSSQKSASGDGSRVALRTSKGSLEDASRTSSSQAGIQLSQMWASAQGRKQYSSNKRDVSQLMDDYDDRAFLHPEDSQARNRRLSNGTTRKAPTAVQLGHVKPFSSQGSALDNDGVSSSDRSYVEDAHSSDSATETLKRTSRKSREISTSSGTPKHDLHPPAAKFSRQISFGLRGFGTTTPKATASTEVFAEHAKSPSLLGRTLRSHGLSRAQEGVTRRDEKAVPESPVLSRPIPIRKNTAFREFHEEGTAQQRSRNGLASAEMRQEDQRNRATATMTHHTEPSGAEATLRTEPEADKTIADLVVAPDVASPWMTVLNPSNPTKTEGNTAIRLRRWQHIFPRPLRASKMKWKSLCSPAAVPITTEESPSSEQLASQYRHSSYRIAVAADSELYEETQSREWLLREMIAIRLSHGFQIVTSPGVTRRPDDQRNCIFDPKMFTYEGLVIHLVKSNTVHQLRYIENCEIEIKCFSRLNLGEVGVLPPSITYRPAIRTMLASEYMPQEIQFYRKAEDLDWQQLDLLLTKTKQQFVNVAATLRFWCARFVLIPVDPPINTRRSLQSSNGDSEEEMRLEGIQRLTQLWQRFRYISPEERRFQVALRQPKGTNPLNIIYQTRNLSAIVAAEKDNLQEGVSASGAIELLPESELYQRFNLNLASLAQTIQSDRGISMVDRRWHWRLHYSCFIGFELTTWLLQNFRDVETREEAVELGNELMDHGLFQHVEQRHNFRDGNYFYQIATDYRTPRPESKSWFGTKKSVPPTPILEAPGMPLSQAPASRSSSNGGESFAAGDPTPSSDKQRLGIALSKALLYDVDHRKRSYRREVITLHYDRLHNPDNCYHIRIEWMNVTSKLIEDTIISWATTIDRYGLKLVEVPLAEASAITDMHHFRAPYLVRLAYPPPSQQPQHSTYFDAKSFSTRTTSDNHFYQKAILKKFRYILDFEAASDFPPDVDVAYSWGVPDYKYAQYIHQSGVLLVQINEEGHFLLLANRLYSNRNAFGQEVAHDALDPKSQSTRSNTHSGSPRASPFSSPVVRPTAEPPRAGTQGPISGYTTPEQLKSELESFCHNATALSTFYDETLHKPVVPRRHTPYTEGNIPTLGLPPNVVLRNRMSASDQNTVEGVVPTSTDFDLVKKD